MIDNSATSDVVVKSKIRALSCMEEALICHTAQSETSDGEEPPADSAEDCNGKEKMWEKFLLKKSVKHWGCLDARKVKRGHCSSVVAQALSRALLGKVKRIFKSSLDCKDSGALHALTFKTGKQSSQISAFDKQ